MGLHKAICLESNCHIFPEGLNKYMITDSRNLTFLLSLHTILFHFKVLFFFSPTGALLTLVLLRIENSLIRNDCLLVPVAMSPRLSHNHFALSSFTAAIFSSAWWQPYCQHKDKKLDLSRELNVPSISTILLIFHQSCGSSSEP